MTSDAGRLPPKKSSPCLAFCPRTLPKVDIGTSRGSVALFCFLICFRSPPFFCLGLGFCSRVPRFLWPTAEIEAAIKSISGKKESLRKAWEVLSSSSSSFVYFNLGWKDLDEHFSALEKSILERFEELQAKEAQITALAVSSRPEAKPTPVAPEPEATPRPELKSFFAEIDARGLRGGIQNDLNPAIRAAPDPAKIVLDVIDGFHPLKSKGHKDDTDTQMIRRTCISLLECVQVIAPEIKPAVRAQAKKLAMEWKGKMNG